MIDSNSAVLPTLAELLAAKDWLAIVRHIEAWSNDQVPGFDWVQAAYRACSALEDHAGAERWLDLSLELVPGNATNWRNKGALQQKRQQWDGALQSYERAVVLRPDIAVYQAASAFAAFQLGRYELAAERFQSAIALDGGKRAWWARLARSLVHLNRLQDAADAYARALAIEDDAATRSARQELLRQIRSGSKAPSSAYYDAVFTDTPKYQEGGEQSEYAPVWTRLVEAMQQLAPRSVLDLGCGPGQFAEFALRRLGELSYTGVDFSGVAVSRARHRCPSAVFERRELPLTDFKGLPVFDTVVCTEVLEHVEKDREILAALPAGTRIVATVPNFDAFGHLRVFRSEDEVRQRYGELIDSLRIDSHRLSDSNLLWILSGTRAAAAWTAPEDGQAAPSAQPTVVRDAAAIVESILWTDGSRYVADFLPQFGLPFVTVDVSRTLSEPHVALRHDVDWSIENAFAMATLEHKLGIRSSYYLLHPDGQISQQNYFGRIDNGQLVIDPALFDWAGRLLDMGHEIGLHNDLITLALATRRQPAEFLEQIVEAFARRGMPLVGSVAHGSRQCRELGYMNYQIFRELKQVHVAVDYQDSPDLFARFAEPEVVRDGHVVRKFELSMADYGLAYEANFVPWEVYLSDSSARWSIWHHSEMRRFDKFVDRREVGQALGEILARKAPRTAVQCLVHACHWSVLAHHSPSAVPAIRKLAVQRFARGRRESMLQRLQAFPNVPLARATERFDAYDQEYGTKSQLYNVTSTVARFIDGLLAGPAAGARRLLEIGCGQGDFLASVHAKLARMVEPGTLRAVGVDGSPAAIVSCAGRYADIEWAADELEHFLGVHDAHLREASGEPLRYDLVLDKTGAIFIDSYDAACEYFRQIDRLMKPGALYVYVASRNYYEESLRKRNYASWPLHWMELIATHFEPVQADDDDAPALRGYYKRAFRKAAPA